MAKPIRTFTIYSRMSFGMAASDAKTFSPVAPDAKTG
jgi:hypothetical protein